MADILVSAECDTILNNLLNTENMGFHEHRGFCRGAKRMFLALQSANRQSAPLCKTPCDHPICETILRLKDSTLLSHNEAMESNDDK